MNISCINLRVSTLCHPFSPIFSHILCPDGHFCVSRFSRYASTFDAIEATIFTLRRLPGFEEIPIKRYPNEYDYYLVHHGRKVAVYLRSVTRSSEGRRKQSRAAYDYAARNVSIEYAKISIRRFLGDFPGYVLAVSTGGLKLEVALFLRMVDDSMEALFFNPIYSSNQLVNVFVRLLRKGTPLRSYHTPRDNVSAQCFALAWQQIFQHVTVGPSPLDNPTLTLTRR